MTNRTYKPWLVGFALALLALLLTGITQSASAASFWNANYYNNRSFSGTPALSRSESTINYNWGTGSPGFGIGNDNFTARWERTEFFDAGRYRFNVSADDGVRVYVDNRIVIDHWVDSAPTALSAEIDLSSGNHTMRVEYYEAGGNASIAFDFHRVGSSNGSGNWQASYWNNTSLSGVPVVQRNENAVNYNWGTGSPASGVNSDFFSAQWRTTTFVNSGTYRMDVVADDGVRVWVNSNLVLDKWFSSAAQSYTVDMFLNQGNYNIAIEYFENQGNAAVSFNFYQINTDNGGGGDNNDDDDDDNEEPQDPYPALTLPADLSGNLRRNGDCLNSNWYVGQMEDNCNKSGKWTFYRHANGRYLIQSAESGKCLQRTQYADGYQLRMHKCDRNNSDQHFNYQLDNGQIRIWLVKQNNRYIGIGGHGGDRAHLVNGSFNWNFSQ